MVTNKFEAGDEIIVENSAVVACNGLIGRIIRKDHSLKGWVIYLPTIYEIFMYEWEIRKVTPLDKLL